MNSFQTTSVRKSQETSHPGTTIPKCQYLPLILQSGAVVHVRRKCESNILRSSQVFRYLVLDSPTVLNPARILRGKHDHIAVGERVFMVFDATIRPSGQVGLEPGAGMKRFTLSDQPHGRMHGIVYARSAVALQ